MAKPLLPEGWRPGTTKRPQPDANPEEYQALAERVYRDKVRPALENEPVGWFLSVDLNSEDYELDENHGKASSQLLARRPDADIFTIRVGLPSAYHLSSIFIDAER